MCRNCDDYGMCRRQCVPVTDSNLVMSFQFDAELMLTPISPFALNYQIARKVTGLSNEELEAANDADFDGIGWFRAENEILGLLKAQLFKHKLITASAEVFIFDACEHSASLCIQELGKQEVFVIVECSLKAAA